MKWLYERLGLLDWWNAWYKTYLKLVLEFFSSVLIYNPQWMEVEDCMLNFRCNGKECTMQAVDFYKIYGFRNGGLRKRDNDIRSESFWPRISDEPIYKSSSSKCSSIRNPVFRCFQRAIANTFLARGDSQNVMRNDELYFLWACFELDEPIDIGYHFLSQLSSIASKKLGKIKIGGMLTPLFTHLKVDLGREEVADGPSVLDLDIFVASGLFRKKGDVVYLANPFLRLPCDRRIRITDENNWKVGPASDGEDDEEEEDEEENEGEDEHEQVEEANQEGGEEDNEAPFDMRSLQFSIRNIGNDTQRILRELARQNQMIQQIGVRQTRVENRVDSIYHHFYPPPQQPPPPPPQE